MVKEKAYPPNSVVAVGYDGIEVTSGAIDKNSVKFNRFSYTFSVQNEGNQKQNEIDLLLQVWLFSY